MEIDLADYIDSMMKTESLEALENQIRERKDYLNTLEEAYTFLRTHSYSYEMTVVGSNEHSLKFHAHNHGVYLSLQGSSSEELILKAFRMLRNEL